MSVPVLHPHLPFLPVLSRAATRLWAMAATVPPASDRELPALPVHLRQYPTPLSPPYPELSRGVELRRAMSASSRSGLFALADGDIVFEDEWLVVVNKPAGIYCEALPSSYSKTHVDESAAAGAVELHLANRLDRDTSGLMVITKSHKVAAKLVQAFTQHKVMKTYIALCIGRSPEWERIHVVSGHGRSKHGAWRVYAVSDVGRTLPGGSVVKHMETTFEVLSVDGDGRFREPAAIGADGTVDHTLVVEDKTVTAAGGDFEEQRKSKILVRAYPRSGRTHQIRLHCQHLGMSIRGDVKYGGVHQWWGEECEIHDLHSESLSFEHPVTGIHVQFHAPIPLWARSACQASVPGGERLESSYT